MSEDEAEIITGEEGDGGGVKHFGEDAPGPSDNEREGEDKTPNGEPMRGISADHRGRDPLGEPVSTSPQTS